MIKELSNGCSETYTVKFWYEGSDDLWRQLEVDLYCNSKSAHKQVAKYFMKRVAEFYKNAKVVSVTYN